MLQLHLMIYLQQIFKILVGLHTFYYGVILMENDDAPNAIPDEPSSNNASRVARAVLNTAAGAIPLVGGTLAAISADWSERDQNRVNEFFEYHRQLQEKQIREQYETIREFVQRLDKIGKDVTDRIKSSEFHHLVEKCLRNWSDINTKSKREYVRNILVNAASTDISSDEVIKLFIDWLNQYSELHFRVIGCIYKHNNGISRGDIWSKIGKQPAREDSAEADLYKLLIGDLSTGSIIRQHRQTDYSGNFIKPPKKTKNTRNTLESAFDNTKLYELTELGKQFVHYAMSDISTKLEYKTTEPV